MEPCAGAGAVADVLRADGGCQVSAFDMAPRREGIGSSDTIGADYSHWFYSPALAVVTNPPFSRAAELWRLAHANRTPLIALLLRLSWLEATQDREDIPSPQTVIVLPRPKFIESLEAQAIRIAAGKAWNGDTVTSAWCIWHPAAPALGVIRVTRAEKRELERLEVAA